MNRSRSTLDPGRPDRGGVAPTLAALGVWIVLGGSVLAAEPAAPAARTSIDPMPATGFVLIRPALPLPRVDAPGSARIDHPALAPMAPAPMAFRSFLPTTFPDGLVARMASEAQRYRGGHVYDLATAPDPMDSIGEELRSEEAERILTRAFNQTLDSRLDTLARSSDRLARGLAHLEDLGASFRPRRSDTGRPVTDALAGVSLGGGDARPSVGFRLGAHPALSVRAGFLGVRGRLDLPLLGEPFRLSLERSLGPRGRAALSAGADRDGRDWAALSLGLSF